MTDRDLNTPEWDVICDALEDAEILIQRITSDIYDGRLSPATARDRIQWAIQTLADGLEC